MIELCGLWLNEGKKGKYMSGNLGGAKIVILKNDGKKEDKHPDYRIFIAEPKPRVEGATAVAPAKKQEEEDDLPF